MEVRLMRETKARRDESLPTGTPLLDDEAMLVAAAKKGDSAAFEQLVKRYQRRISCLVQGMTRNFEDTEDVVQDAFASAYVHLRHFRGGSRFYTWLVRIAINAALMKRRKEHRSKQVALVAPTEAADGRPTPEQRYSQWQRELSLATAMRHLSPALRKVCQLRRVEELTTDEAARALGLSASAVKSRLHRSLQSLRLELSPHSERQVQK
jgi:RNA polymerase sigma-70 factor, ECF subfamily